MITRDEKGVKHMRIENSEKMYASMAEGNKSSEQVMKAGGKEKGKENRPGAVKDGEGAIFAGNLTIPGDRGDRIEEEKQKARNLAKQLIEKAWGKDNKMSGSIEEHIDLHRQKLEEAKEIGDKLSDIHDERRMLREEYGITEESADNEELSLLRKEKKAKKDSSIVLSEEEKEKLLTIHVRGLTTYESEMLRLDIPEEEYLEQKEKNERDIKMEARIIRGLKIEQVKPHDMVDAKKQVSEVMTAANKAILGMVMEDGMNAIDEKAEEEKQEAKEKKEEREEIEERIASARERARQREDNLDEMYEIDSIAQDIKKAGETDTTEDVKKSLTQVINELKITKEDVKGVAVDQKL